MKKPTKATPSQVHLGKKTGEVYLIYLLKPNDVSPTVLCASNTAVEASRIIENIKPQLPSEEIEFGYKKLSIIKPQERLAPFAN